MADGFNNKPRDPVVDGAYTGGDLLSKFGNWDKILDAHWSGWRQEAKEMFDYVAGRQWTKDEIDQMEGIGRIPIVFNRIAPTIDAVAGAEIGARQQVQYFPRQVGDTAVDDILTQGAEWVMGECEGEYEDSDAFRDCLVCGIGVTETRPDFDQETQIIKERVDPLEIEWDSSSRKPCFADARYLRRKKPMSKERFKEMWPEASYVGDQTLDAKQPVIVDPRIRYDGTNEDQTIRSDEVIVREYQWMEEEDRWLIGGPLAQALKAQFPNIPTRGEFVELEAEQHAEVQEKYPYTPTAKIKSKTWWRAFVAGSQILEPPTKLEAGSFSYKAMTGKRDRNKNYWYGLVRPMVDPQRWANKFFSQILHIMRTNAQGGLIMEEDAPLDIRQFEESWTDPAAITYVKKGTISNPAGKKFDIKPGAQYPQGLDRLMEMSVQSIRDTTGVNQEMLGLADRNQPGVLEYQRQNQAFGILAPFFDGKRRYHKMQGKLLLKLMQLYLPPDKLIRVTGTDNNPQYVPLALANSTIDYDVIVDEAPAGPNQKAQTFQMLVQLMPLLQNAGLGADVWAEIARYSPLPGKLAELIASSLTQKQQAEQQQAPVEQQLQMQERQAKVADISASAQHHAAQAELLKADAIGKHVETIKGVFAPPEGPSDEETRAKINLDRAKTSQILSGVVRDLETPPPQPKEPKE